MLSQELILQLQSIIERKCGEHLELDVVTRLGEAYTKFYEILIKMDRATKELKEKNNNRGGNE